MAFFKNVGSQVVQCQVTTAADGSDFTGSVTVSVTGDGGTRATGSVGSGAATHEGGGLHSYVPAQAETNYETVSYQFAGTGAITAAVTIYPLPALVSTDDVEAACEAGLDDWWASRELDVAVDPGTGSEALGSITFSAPA